MTPPPPIRPDIRAEFLLDPTRAHLNHGSFGAVPRVVFEAHNHWREQIESDPIEFIVRRAPEMLESAKQEIGRCFGMAPQDFGLVTNATEGINCVLRSREFSPGDELLTTTHVYNAVRQAMRYVARRSGATYREIEILMPLDSADTILRTIFENLTPSTKLLVIDHITSPTAIVFPIEQILAACAERNIDVLIDGAHAPGMMPLNIGELSPAYYAGNLHKWALCPKGSAFLWVRPDRQAAVHPTVISHHFEKGFLKEVSWQGTRDFAAWFAIARAIQFLNEIGLAKVFAHNHAMAIWVHQTLCQRWNVQPLTPLDGSLLGAMATVRLPPPLDALTDSESQALGRRLHDEFRIEVPTMIFGGKCHLRPCCQIYNQPDEYLRLADAISKIAV
jgi:isopenicillin-N epimerase